MRKIWWSGLLIVSGLLFSLPVFSQQRWERTYGGAGDDRGYSVQQTADGGYVVAGKTNSFGNGNQVYLIKTDASGDTLWTKTYMGMDSSYGYSVQQTSDGGYIVAGFSNYHACLIKTNASGVTLWTRVYGDTSIYGSLGYSVQQTADGGYIVAGLFSTGYATFYLIKTNASGDTIWTRTYGWGNDSEGYSVRQTSDGGYIIAGWTNSIGHGTYDVYLIKTNASGDTLWTKAYGGTATDGGYSIQQTIEGGYIIAGFSNSFGHGNYDVYLVKTNASGDTLWTKTYGGADDDEGWSVQQTTDGGYIVAGYTNSFGNDYQVYLIKTDPSGNVGVENDSPGRIKPLTSNLSFSVVPNPFTSFASVPGHFSDRFTLYDVSGRKVGTYRGDRIGFDLTAGIYFLKPESKDAKPLRLVKLR